MKKLGSIAAILLIIIAGAWFYLANNFEKMAKEELLPKIQNNDSVITANLDSVIIEKFRFRLTLKDVTLFPESQHFVTSSDQMLISYNPFTDKITICFNGEKLSTGSGKIATYIPSPNQSMSFNKSLLENDFDDIDIKMTSKDNSTYFTEDDKFIARTASSSFNLSSKLGSDGMYSIDLGLNFNGMDINPDSKYLVYLLENLLPKAIKDDMNLDDNSFSFINYYYNMTEKTGPINYNTEYSIQLSKNHVQDIIDSLKGKKEFSDIYKEFSFTEEIYSLSIKESFGNSAMKDTGSFYLAGDGIKIDANMDMSLSRSYTNGQKEEITIITNDFLYELTKQLADGNKLNLKTDFNEATDLMPISTLLTNIEKLNFSFNVVYDITSTNFDHSLKIGLNDFTTKLTGTKEDKVYSADVIVSTPMILVDGVTNFYNAGIRPLLAKNTGATEIKSFDQIMNNIKNNGFNALAAFHNNEELKENDALVSGIIFNPQGFKLKINDKNFFKLLTDERIVKFLQNMPNENEQGN